MNTTLSMEQAADRFGRSVAARLSASEQQLPYVVTERLRASREQALSQRKRAWVGAQAPALETAGATAALGTTAGLAGGPMRLWLRNLLTALPIAAMVAGVAFVSVAQDHLHETEVAEIDAALLTDELPPTAYTDPGFIQYLQTSRTATN